MKQENDNVVFVGDKDKSAYVQATFYCLDNHGTAILKALGSHQTKAVETAETVAQRDDCEIESMSGIEKSGTCGIEIEVAKNG